MLDPYMFNLRVYLAYLLYGFNIQIVEGSVSFINGLAEWIIFSYSSCHKYVPIGRNTLRRHQLETPPELAGKSPQRKSLQKR
jgi:hypothetical protein